MTDSEQSELSAAKRAAQDAVHGLAEVRADQEFRLRLAREFVTGRFSIRPVEVPVPLTPLQILLRWIYLPAAAAVLALVVMFFNGRGPAWEIVGVSGLGEVTLNGVAVPSSDRADLDRLMAPGAGLSLSADAQLTLEGSAMLALQALPGTEMTVPNHPGRWIRRSLRVDVREGEVRFMTGPRLGGRSLVVKTPEGRVEVSGTVFSVVRDAAARTTCVCIMTGEARIGATEADMEPVAAGRRKVMFGDGRRARVLEIEPGHRAGLARFDRRFPSALWSEASD
jgi:hypothetical protein